jgi:hypothetical protein
MVLYVDRKSLLVALVLVAVIVLAIVYFQLWLRMPGQSPQQVAPESPVETQPAQPAVNVTQFTPGNVSEPQRKPPIIVARVETGLGGNVLANGTGTEVWSSTRPFVLVLEAVPDKGYAFDYWQVNGTDAGGQLRLNITVAGNTTVTAVFKKVSFTARFLNVTVPVKVFLNATVPVSLNATGRIYTGDFQLGFNKTTSIFVAPYGADDAGCVPYNSTHKACILGWLNGTKPLYVRYLRAELTQDTNFTQLWMITKANYSATLIDIWVGNTTIKTTAEPSKTLLIPFDATYEVVNGWFHIKGGKNGAFGFNIKMPPWKKIKVYVNYTANLSPGGGQMPALITVMVRNGPVYQDIGTSFGTIPLTVFTIDRQLVDLYANALQQCNYSPDCMRNFFDTENDYYKYLTCYNLAWNNVCTPGKTMQGPGNRLEPGDWQPGDLQITGSGEMWIKIEILE